MCANTSESTFVSRPCLSCCRLSVVVWWSLSGHPRPSSAEALVYRGCPCRDPPVGHRVHCGKAPTLVCVGVVTSCVLCACVRGRVSRSCATENTYTLDWKRCSSSQSSPFSVICIVRSNMSAGCGCSVQLVILFDTFFISFEISSKISCLL